jgi:hypothetical protein
LVVVLVIMKLCGEYFKKLMVPCGQARGCPSPT